MKFPNLRFLRLRRISHKLATAAADASALTALCSVGLLEALHEYHCGDLGRTPCQARRLHHLASQAYVNCGLSANC